MKKGQNWTPIYLMVILIIAAILIFAIVKPMFQEAAAYAETALPGFLIW